MTNAAPLRVLLISAEAAPLAKTGGLGDMLAALAPALRARGIDVRLLMPCYGWINRTLFARHSAPLPVRLGNQELVCSVLEGTLSETPIYLLENDPLYDREFVYGPPSGDYADNLLRFATLSRAAIDLCHHLDWWPDVYHAHDWQASLVPVYLNAAKQQHAGSSVLTIHNLAYQGWFGWPRSHDTGLSREVLCQLGLAQNDGINLLKGGIQNSQLVTTVSPTYAREIQTSRHGEGLDQVLRSRRADLFGVLNAVNTAVWNPAIDPLIPRRYTATDLSGKRFCKAALQQRAGLPERPDIPLIGVVARLVKQKGIDLLIKAADQLLKSQLQLVILGTGDPQAEHALRDLAERRPDQVRAWIQFDESLAHLIEAGADFFLMPSRWEPCGLNQMYSQLYGTLPIVRHTGGLADTVENFDEASGSGTGFSFHDPTPDALAGTVRWAVGVYHHNKTAVQAMIQRVMNLSYSWDECAGSYEYFYRLAAVRGSS